MCSSDLGRANRAEVRFIEYMDVGGATQWSMNQVLPAADMRARLATRYGAVEPIPDESSAPARRFRLPDGTTFGIIASTTQPFCRDCDRSRLTADGLWYLCLYSTAGVDLRKVVRSGASPAEVADLLRQHWEARQDRGAEARLATGSRAPLIPIDRLRRDPHLEMHTRGG